ncbi:hypothetical protein SCLCIDRAFT_184288 [Scleroderma citrinum Foug A]|uniref:Uncharacterized protein n=1 Tax=Scleroderma citrinum Foug A TaxID=1036808 RepID=A0A0C3DMC7_9AGAM|nr:hypothetical protein SCLCIDRAFT_184288 [Scleroderma citrinum Foug A]
MSLQPRGRAIFYRARYIAFSWIGQLIFDVLVFILTLLQTLRIHNLEGQRSITGVLLWDGCLYFAVICCGVIATMNVLLKATDSHKGLMCNFTNAIGATLISRLMLNLRDPRLTDMIDSSLFPLSHANMVFAPGDIEVVRIMIKCSRDFVIELAAEPGRF